jgi:hypothetical protein
MKRQGTTLVVPLEASNKVLGFSPSVSLVSSAYSPSAAKAGIIMDHLWHD